MSTAKSLTVFKQTFSSDRAQGEIRRVLGENAEAFTSSLISLTAMTPGLQKCDPNKVLGEAMKAAVLDLPLDKSLGLAFIVPYGNVPQFQIGYRGWIQLAQRTGAYKAMNALEIKEGELKPGADRLKEDYEFEFISDEEERMKKKTIGYAFYFKTIYGFEKTIYLSKEQAMAHGKRYSKSFSRPDSGWQVNPDAMCLKTLILMGLKKWGPVTVKTQALTSAISEDPDYSEEPLDPEKEVKLPEDDQEKQPKQNPKKPASSKPSPKPRREPEPEPVPEDERPVPESDEPMPDVDYDGIFGGAEEDPSKW